MSFAQRRQSPEAVEGVEAAMVVAEVVVEHLEAVWMEGARAELEEQAGWVVQVVKLHRK
jgi:hypothetical protein